MKMVEHLRLVDKIRNSKNGFSQLISSIRQNNLAINPYYISDNVVLFNYDSLEVLSRLPEDSIDMIFADPPYMLSNNGFTCQNGRMVSVNKGKWDKSKGLLEDMAFHDAWIKACRRVLKPEGTIWISGTYHSIYQCGYLLQANEFHILNDIAWFKPNAAPNLSCRFFTASHETIIWARKDKKAKHTFNYELMKNGDFPEDPLKKENTQMRSVWSIPTPQKLEKAFGKHPTQKPLALLSRIVLASTKPGDILLDPFNGSGTTGVACQLAGDRYFIGVEISPEYCEISKLRFQNFEKERKELLYRYAY